MTSVDMLGRNHVLQRARAKGIEPAIEKFAAPPVFQGNRPVVPTAAIEFLRNRVPIPSRTVEKLVRGSRRRGKAAIDELIRQLTELLDEEIARGLRAGETIESFSRRLTGILERAGVGTAEPFRLETIFRTNATQAYTAGRLAQLEHPDVAEEFQWLQYNAVLDGATRPTHAAMNGKVYRSDSPVWDEWMPPNGFNCRCSVTPVAKDDIKAEKLTVSRKPPQFQGNTVRPDTNFRFNGAKAFEDNPTAGLPTPRPEPPAPKPLGAPRRAAPKRAPRKAAPPKPAAPAKRRREKPARPFVPRPPPTKAEVLKGRTFEVVEGVNVFGKKNFTPTVNGRKLDEPSRRRFAAQRRLDSFKQQLVDRALALHREAEEFRKLREQDEDAALRKAISGLDL